MPSARRRTSREAQDRAAGDAQAVARLGRDAGDHRLSPAVTRAEIEQVRGVGLSKGTLDLLFEQNWIKPMGRRRAPGKPVTWGTTDFFLEHFGLPSLDDLPGQRTEGGGPAGRAGASPPYSAGRARSAARTDGRRGRRASGGRREHGGTGALTPTEPPYFDRLPWLRSGCHNRRSLIDTPIANRLGSILKWVASAYGTG